MRKDVPFAALRRRASGINSIVMHRLRSSCSNAPLCHNLLSGQIRSHCKTPIASRTNCIVMPLCRCLSCCWQFFTTIWFVQTATVSMHYDTICPAAENSFSLRYNLSYCWQQFLITIRFILLLKTVFITIWFVQTAAKLVREMGKFVSFCNDKLGTT